MNVILLEKIRNLGTLGDKVNVKAGYARNFLIPQGKAVFATKENLAEFALRKAELERKAAEALQVAQQKAIEINALSAIKLTARTSDEGKLFGSIGLRDIATAVTASGVAIEKHQINVPQGSIHEIGEYDIDILLHTEVSTKVTIVVVAEK